jgi:hypothetical protein
LKPKAERDGCDQRLDFNSLAWSMLSLREAPD